MHYYKFFKCFCVKKILDFEKSKPFLNFCFVVMRDLPATVGVLNMT